MEPIIKLAIEGGYFGLTQWDLDNKNYDQNCLYSVVCDPLFWEALGKVCGWDKNEITEHEHFTDFGDDRPHYHTLWQYIAIKFHYINLTEGMDKAVAYLLTQVPTRGTALVN